MKLAMIGFSSAVALFVAYQAAVTISAAFARVAAAFAGVAA